MSGDRLAEPGAADAISERRANTADLESSGVFLMQPCPVEPRRPWKVVLGFPEGNGHGFGAIGRGKTRRAALRRAAKNAVRHMRKTGR